MLRPMRIEYPEACYRVMSRGLSGRNIFLEDKDRERFLELLGETLTTVEGRGFCLLFVR